MQRGEPGCGCGDDSRGTHISRRDAPALERGPPSAPVRQAPKRRIADVQAGRKW